MVTKSRSLMATPPKEPKRGLGCFYALLAVFALLLALGFFSFSSGIAGTEFSPNTFQTRAFSYSRIPGTRTRLAPTTITPNTAVASIDVLKHLPTLTRPQEWHIAEINGSDDETQEAYVLVNALKQRNADGNDMWGSWSVLHPSEAAIFWPIVQQVAFQRLYECIPELLQLAELARDPVSLERESLEVVIRAVTARMRRSSEESQTTDLLSWLSGFPVKDPENNRWLENQQRELVETPPAIGR
jgi:hypothetical protein